MNKYILTIFSHYSDTGPYLYTEMPIDECVGLLNDLAETKDYLKDVGQLVSNSYHTRLVMKTSDDNHYSIINLGISAATYDVIINKPEKFNDLVVLAKLNPDNIKEYIKVIVNNNVSRILGANCE